MRRTIAAITRVHVGQPLDLRATLNSGQAFRWHVVEGGWYEGVLGNDIVRLRLRGDDLEVWGGPGSVDALAGRVWSYLRLNDDLPMILKTLEKDDHVTAAIRRYPGLRLLQIDPWECLVSFLLSSVSSIPRIARTVEALANAFGHCVDLGDTMRYTFPSPKDLSLATEMDLLALGTGYRARYLVEAARAVMDGSVDVWALRDRDYDQARKTLMSLAGVGEKVADCILLHALDKVDAFPVDRWMRRALSEWYGLSPQLNSASVRAWALRRFGPYAGYAEVYLFHRRRLQ